MRVTFHRTHGFTLIEIMVVVSIILLLLAVAVPVASMLNQGQALENGGRVVVGAFTRARSESVAKRIPHGVVFLESGMAVVRLGDKPEYVGDVQKLPQGVKLYPFCAQGVSQYSRGDQPPQGVKDLPPVAEAASLVRQGFWFTPTGDLHAALPYKNDPAGKIGNDPYDFLDTNAGFHIMSDAVATDIVLFQTGNNAQRCFIDLPKSGGQFRMRVLNVSKTGKTVTK